MTDLTFDFSDVKEFEAFEPGTYNAKLTGFKDKPSKSGKPMITLEFTLDGELEGRKVWRNYTLTQEALRYAKEALVALGADPDDFTGKVDIRAMVAGLISAPCTLDIGREPYQGKDRNQVERVRAYQPSGW